MVRYIAKSTFFRAKASLAARALADGRAATTFLSARVHQFLVAPTRRPSRSRARGLHVIRGLLASFLDGPIASVRYPTLKTIFAGWRVVGRLGEIFRSF